MENILVKETKGTINLIKELEEYYKKNVVAIVYNPYIEYGIKDGDDLFFEFFMERFFKKKAIKHSVIILSGFGGDLKASVLCSSILKENLDYYCCFVPSVICSSLCYFVLQSNKLIMGKNSILTQIDPLIEYEEQNLIVIKNLRYPDNNLRKKDLKSK